MLKKLLLISLTASALAACGGSIGPSAEDARTATNNPEPPAPAPEPEEPGPECDPSLAHFYFDSQEDVDQWFIYDDGPNVQLSLDPETQSAMLITPLQWSGDDLSHQRQARVELEEAMDLQGGTIEYELDIPAAYIEDGNLVFQFVMAEPYMDSGWITMEPFAEVAAAVAEEGDSVTIEDVPTVSFNANTAVTMNPFTGRYIVTITGPNDADNVTHLGLQMAQMPTDQTILEPIALHKVTLSELPPAECLDVEQNKVVEIDFTEEVEFGNDGVVDVSLDAEEEALRITPDFSDAADKSIFVILTEEQMYDFTGATIEFVVDVPQSYIDAGMSLQPFIQQNDGGYTGDWGGWQDNGNLEAGENTFTYSPQAIENARRVGIKPMNVEGAPEGDLLLREITITYDGGGEGGDDSSDAIVSLDFEDEDVSGWGGWTGSAFELATDQAHSGDNSLLITNREDNGVGAYTITSLVETDTTYTVSAQVMITGSADDTVAMTRILKCADPAPEGHGDYSNITTNEAVPPGEWVELTGEFSTDGCEITEAQVYFEGTGADIDVYVDDFTISIAE